MAKMTKEDLVRIILEEEHDLLEDDEILHLIIQEKISKDIAAVHRDELSVGSRMADKLAKFAGSWKFIIIFIIIMFLWVSSNVYILSNPFDRYPFILLNLILSCIAALQAPVIMMSQNRQEEKDRLRSVNDYRVNLKSEVIVQDIHEKLDHLIKNQQLLIDRVFAMETEKNATATIEAMGEIDPESIL